MVSTKSEIKMQPLISRQNLTPLGSASGRNYALTFPFLLLEQFYLEFVVEN